MGHGRGAYRAEDERSPTPDFGQAAAAVARSGRAQLHPLKYAGYYVLAFFASWLGARRLDVNGNGELDPEDVHRFLEERAAERRRLGRPHPVCCLFEALGLPFGSTIGTSTSSAHTDRTMTSVIPAQNSFEDNMPQDKAKLKTKTQPQAQETRATETIESDVAPVGLNDADASAEQGRRRGFPEEVRDALALGADGGEAEHQIYHNLIVKRILPYFCVVECVVVLTFWIVGSNVYCGKNGCSWVSSVGGLDTASVGLFDLRWSNFQCEDLRPQVWRWFTYQFTHVGLPHVGMNCLLLVMMGVPLEGLHGWWRVGLMFNAGVFGGAMNYFLTDAHSFVVGCSGGCYALIGIHFADLIINWRDKKFRYLTLTFLITMLGADIGNYLISGEKNISHAAHVGGAVAGLATGIILCRNLNRRPCERLLEGTAGLAIVFLTIAAWIWIAANIEGPRNIFEASTGTSGWCSVLMYWDVKLPNNEKMFCTRCGTASCVADLRSQYNADRCCPRSGASCPCYAVVYQTTETCNHYATWRQVP